jgi:hypothetical protein
MPERRAVLAVGRHIEPEDIPMKKLLLIAAAFVAVSIAAPANAQVNIRAGESGVGVRVGPGHDRGVHRNRGAHRSDWRRSRARDCRTVRTRTVTPSGRVIMNTRRVCR